MVELLEFAFATGYAISNGTMSDLNLSHDSKDLFDGDYDA